MGCLGRERSVEYSLLTRPDENVRNAPAADFLFEASNGHKEFVEFTWFTQGVLDRNATQIQKGESPPVLNRKRARKEEEAWVQQGIRNTRRTEASLAGDVTSFEAQPLQLQRLCDEVIRKLEKGQLEAEDVDERMLLVVDKHYVFIDSDLDGRDTPLSLVNSMVDGVYIITEQRIVRELWRR